MQITGRRYVNFVNNYSSLSEKQQEDISSILSFSNTDDKAGQLASIGNMASEEYQSSQSCRSLESSSQMPLTGLASLITGTIVGGTFTLTQHQNTILCTVS